MAETERLALISKDEKGRTKLEYTKQGARVIKLWEPNQEMVLETTFDAASGSILIQRAMKTDTGLTDYLLKESLHEADVKEIKQVQFNDVSLNKPCPTCNEFKLSRFVEAFHSKKEVPVMPIYYCTNCKNKSYHLTDKYLEYLVESNMKLFSESELSEMEKDRNVFASELKSYIIRIFASKKIQCIK